MSVNKNKNNLMIDDIRKTIVGLVVFISSIILIKLSLTTNTKYNIHYSNKSNIDYNVYLKPNNFYETTFLPKDKQYISSLIDYIDINFDYTFKKYENTNLEYSYYINATILIDNLQGKNIYNNEKTIVNKKPFNPVTNDTFSVNENVKIDYAMYNNLTTSFINNYGISANSKVVVSLYVDILGKDAEFVKEINKKPVSSLEIPLTNKNIDITMNSKLSNNSDEVMEYKSTVISLPILLTLAIILAITDIILVIVIIIYTIRKCDVHTLYNLKLKRILKDYDRYITETAATESVPELLNDEKSRVEIVKSFDNLINVRESIEKPILYHEERPGEEAVFYIFDDKVTYIYIMYATDLKKK